MGTKVRLLDDTEIFLPRHIKILPKKQQIQIAVMILKNMVRVAVNKAPKATQMKDLEWLQDYCYVGDSRQEEGLLRVGVVAQSDEIRSIFNSDASEDYALEYNSVLGYQAKGRK